MGLFNSFHHKYALQTANTLFCIEYLDNEIFVVFHILSINFQHEIIIARCVVTLGYILNT